MQRLLEVEETERMAMGYCIQGMEVQNDDLASLDWATYALLHARMERRKLPTTAAAKVDEGLKHLAEYTAACIKRLSAAHPKKGVMRAATKILHELLRGDYVIVDHDLDTGACVEQLVAEGSAQALEDWRMAWEAVVGKEVAG
jgi:hypothetical protein